MTSKNLEGRGFAIMAGPVPKADPEPSVDEVERGGDGVGCGVTSIELSREGVTRELEPAPRINPRMDMLCDRVTIVPPRTP